MSTWLRHNDKVKGKEPLCGTVGCFAGHLVVQVLGEATNDGRIKFEALPRRAQTAAEKLRRDDLHIPWGETENHIDIQGAAASILNLAYGEDDKLFYVRQWPIRFQKWYRRPSSVGVVRTVAERQQSRANALVARVRHWMKTGE